MAKGKRKLSPQAEQPIPYKPKEKVVIPAWKLWAESVDLSDEARSARTHPAKVFRHEVDEIFDIKIREAVAARAWHSVKHIFNQYGNYLELIS